MVGEDERVGLQLRRVVEIGSGSDTLVNEGILAKNIPPSGDGCDSLTWVGVGGVKYLQVVGGGGNKDKYSSVG